MSRVAYSISIAALVAVVPIAACGLAGAASGGNGGFAADGGAASSATGSGGGIELGGGTTHEGAGGTGGGEHGDATGTKAIAVDAFLGSIGVCTHVGQGVDDPTQSATALAYAGFRGIRDDGNPAHVDDWIAMHQSAKVRLSLLTNQDVTSTVDMAKKLHAAGALLAVEGPNEPNNFPVTYGGQTSNGATFAPVANLQRDLYAAVKAEPKLAGVPVFHSSEAGGAEPDNVGLQFLTIPAGAGTAMPDGTKYADFANTHNYVCGHQFQLVDNVCWSASDPTLNGDWDGPYAEYGVTWNRQFNGYSDPDLITLPKVTTETGWLTSGGGAITEEQQGRLFLNLYFAAFKRGFSYTFIYMLRDDPNQGYWGLFDTSYQAKTSGTYLHNLTTILADGGMKTTPEKLDYSIANEPATVHDLLLEKDDGTFALVVWDEHPNGGSDAVTIDLKKPRPKVEIYDPTTGTQATTAYHDVSVVTVTLSDHPMILTL